MNYGKGKEKGDKIPTYWIAKIRTDGIDSEVPSDFDKDDFNKDKLNYTGEGSREFFITQLKNQAEQNAKDVLVQLQTDGVQPRQYIEQELIKNLLEKYENVPGCDETIKAVTTGLYLKFLNDLEKEFIDVETYSETDADCLGIIDRAQNTMQLHFSPTHGVAKEIKFDEQDIIDVYVLRAKAQMNSVIKYVMGDNIPHDEMQAKAQERINVFKYDLTGKTGMCMEKQHKEAEKTIIEMVPEIMKQIVEVKWPEKIEKLIQAGTDPAEVATKLKGKYLTGVYGFRSEDPVKAAKINAIAEKVQGRA